VACADATRRQMAAKQLDSDECVSNLQLRYFADSRMFPGAARRRVEAWTRPFRKQSVLNGEKDRRSIFFIVRKQR